MKKIIEIDVIDQDDLLDKYNRRVVSKNLIEYLIQVVPYFTREDKIQVIVHNKIKEVPECVPLIVKGFREEYEKNVLEKYRNNVIQLVYFILGILILFFSTLIKSTVLKEIALIGGWVFIWEMIHLELFSDMTGRKRRKILKKLLNSEIVEEKDS